jgi:CO/xanthine dehydrogenase Mo-binding subunit
VIAGGVGEPVALIIATDMATARRATASVQVEYEELPYVVDAEEAMAPGAPLVHDEYEQNECGMWKLRKGDVEAAWGSCHRVYEDVYRSPPASHVPMEPHVAVAQWNGDRLTVWTAAQAPYMVHKSLTRVFKRNADQVRVHTLNLGGGYGAKGGTKIEPMAAAAAHAVEAPVRLELRREEVFHAIGKHAARVRISTGVSDEGRILARKIDVVWNAGAYAITSPKAAAQGLVRAPGPYEIEHVWVDSTARYTNTVPSGPFRGAMTSQLCWAYETQLDHIASDLGIDPLEIRRRNVLRNGSVYATGERMHDMCYEELLDELETFADSRRTSSGTSQRPRGVGVAVMIKSTLTPSRSEARVRFHADGAIELLVSSVEMGQGAHATMVLLLAEALDIPPGRIRLPQPDTDESPFDTTTASSRTTFSMGTATRAAAEDLKRQLGELAAKAFGVDAAQVTHQRGRVVIDNPGDALAWEDLLERSGIDELVAEGAFESEGSIDPETGQGRATVHWHQGGVAAEVEVDTETGRVVVTALHGAAYAGRVISPLRVRQQIIGSMVFGLGPALFEELVYDNGQIVNPNLSDYMIPSIVDVPVEVTTGALENDEPDPELHGVGEMTVPPLAPAIANAIRQAVGAEIRDLPITPERVLRALLSADRSDRGNTRP